MKDFIGFLFLLLPVIANGSFRIVGGEITDISEVPYQASVWGPHKSCGGTIISERSVLTAAHCFDKDRPGRHVYVSVGSNDNLPNGGTPLKAKEVYVHEKFINSPFAYDIAVVYVSTAFTLSETVKKAILPQQNDVLSVGRVGRVSGWGTEHHESKTGSEKLKSIHIKVVQQEDCDQVLIDRYGASYVVEKSFFCAAEDNFESNICSGDSGGGFVTDDNVVHGVTSWSIACGHKKLPSGFSRVAFHLDFIADTNAKFFQE